MITIYISISDTAPYLLLQFRHLAVFFSTSSFTTLFVIFFSDFTNPPPSSPTILHLSLCSLLLRFHHPVVYFSDPSFTPSSFSSSPISLTLFECHLFILQLSWLLILVGTSLQRRTS
ncbi:hypothetical protein LINPERPRIM_LOCUS14540 [Linum perenne]